MTPQQRDATIQHFMNNPGVTVFLISLKAGGVALVSFPFLSCEIRRADDRT
jgi:hypothetical protein